MAVTKLTCTGCSCLCDDIESEGEGPTLGNLKKACTKGSSFLHCFDDIERHAPCSVDGRNVEVEEAINAAANMLKQSKKPLIFGLDNSTLEAQSAGIELARKLRAVIDDCSSFCQGALVERILTGAIPTCSFDEVTRSGMLTFWGSNPYHSHPRHLSKFSYYAHTKYRELGWYPDVVLSCIDVRESELASISKPFFRILPGEDKEFIQAVVAAVGGEAQRKDAMEFVSLAKESKFCVIFAGLGLTYSLDADLSSFEGMVQTLGTLCRVAVIPMIGHFNMRGFNRTLFEQTGFVNKVSFADGVNHGYEFSVLEQIRGLSPDCMLVVGADPISSMPRTVMNNLSRVPLITIDPLATPTTRASKVVLRSAVSSLETDGSAVRMDGADISFTKARSTQRLSDEAILNKLIDGVGR